MKVLLYDLGSYSQQDLILYFESIGVYCKNIRYKLTNRHSDEFFERKFSEFLSSNDWDFVMSTNYFPILAKICKKHNKKYVAWVYDSPMDVQITEDIQYENSYIFIFDRIEANRLISLGGVNIFHAPLAINPYRSQNYNLSKHHKDLYSCDISFVGQFYSTPIKFMEQCQSNYNKGYMDAIIQTQLRIYGYNFLQEIINDDFTLAFKNELSKNNIIIENDITPSHIIYNLNRYITHTERLILCNLLGKTHSFNYYSSESPDLLSHLKYCGTVQYYTEMPAVFLSSKLNLNPTLKSIQSGIPLRALDILNYGGTLFSNFQLELAESFNDGEDVIMYTSIEDALDKADFYLNHDDIRQQITINGHNKVIDNFSYEKITPIILKKAGLI